MFSRKSFLFIVALRTEPFSANTHTHTPLTCTWFRILVEGNVFHMSNIPYHSIHSFTRLFSWQLTARSSRAAQFKPRNRMTHCMQMFSHCIAKNKVNRWKNRWSTLLPGHPLAKRVNLPSMSSSASVLWLRMFSSLNRRPTTM